MKAGVVLGVLGSWGEKGFGGLWLWRLGFKGLALRGLASGAYGCSLD